jgi:hypothetical protein
MKERLAFTFLVSTSIIANKQYVYLLINVMFVCKMHFICYYSVILILNNQKGNSKEV